MIINSRKSISDMNIENIEVYINNNNILNLTTKYDIRIANSDMYAYLNRRYHYSINLSDIENNFYINNGNVEVQLGEDGNEQDSEFFKLRNLVSVLKKRGL